MIFKKKLKGRQCQDKKVVTLLQWKGSGGITGVATADDILFLSKWAPDYALARVFKKDVMTIYRLRTALGRYNLVGATVKTPAVIPTEFVADEKHSTIVGEKVYLATTVGQHCFLGVSVSSGAGDEDLTRAYRQFQSEA